MDANQIKAEIDILVADKPQVQLPKLSPEEDRLIKVVRQKWDQWRTWFESAGWKERVRDSFRRVNATVDAYDDIDDEWRGINGHPLRLALEYAILETYKTRMLKYLLENSDVVKIVAKKKDTVENAKLMNEVVQHFNNEDNFDQKLIVFVDQLCRYPGCPWFVYQKQEKEYYTEVVEEKQKIGMLGFNISERTVKKEVQKEKFKVNVPVWEIYDIENVAFDPRLGSFDKSPYKIFRVIISRAEASRMFPQFARYFDAGVLDWDGQNDFMSDRQGEVSKGTEVGSKTSGLIECLYWLEPSKYVIVFGNKLVLTLEGPGREVPAGMTSILPNPFEPYGNDLVNLSADYADLWNEMINIDLDSTKLATSLQFKIKKNSGVNYNSIFGAPGNMWEVENMDDVQVEQFTYQSGSALKLLEYVGQKEQEITGATNAASGTPIQSAKFAEDIKRMASEVNNRFWLASLHIKLALKEVIREKVRHIQEFVAPTLSPANPLVYMITGKKGFDQREIDNPNDLLGDFDYKISLDVEDINKDLVRAQLIKAIEIVSTNPRLAPFANPAILIKLIFQAFPNIKELEELTGSPADQLMALLDQLDSQQLFTITGLIDKMLAEKLQSERSERSAKQPASAVPVRTPQPALKSPIGQGPAPVPGINQGRMF